MLKKILIIITVGLIILSGFRLAHAQDDEQFERDDRIESEADQSVKTPPTLTTPTATAAVTAAVTSNSQASNIDQNSLAQTSLAHTSTGTPWAWYIARAAGITSLLLLILVAITGIGVTTGILFRYLSPTRSWWWHRAISIALIFSVLTHVGALLFDHYIKFTLADVLIPLRANFKPTGVALGIFGFYIFWPVILSSLYWIQTKNFWWRLIHYLTFVMFILVFWHSIMVGTDTHTWPMQLLYWSTGIAFALMTIWRIWKVIKRRLPPNDPLN